MRFWHSLAFRLFAFLLAIGILVFLPMTILILFESRKNLEYQILSSARQTNDLIINTTRYSMLKNDRKAIDKTVLSLKRIPEIDLLRIYSKKGISFSTNKEDIGTEVDMKVEQCIVCHRTEQALEEIPAEEALQIFTSAEGHRYVTKIDPIYNSRACSLTDCHPKPSEQKVLGMLETRMSLVEVDNKMAASRSHMILLSITAIVIIEAFAAVFIWFFVHKRVNLLTQGALKVGEGDLGHRVEMRGRDELGALSQSFNEMVSKIQAQTRRNISLLENIARAVKVFSETTVELYNITSQQSAGTTEQVATIQELLSSSEELSATARQISEATASVNQAAEGAAETSNLGVDFIIKSVAGMDLISEQVGRVKEHISNLSEQAQSIGSVIDIIEEISEQTELIALNAAIEAAGAGEAGKRFDVVASEVRRLATKAMESTESIKQMIKEIRNSIDETVMVGEEEERVVTSEIQSVKQLVDYFEKILNSTESTRTASSEISDITRQQSSASEHMVAAVKEVEKVAGQVEGGVKEIESLMGELKSMTEQLHALIDEGEGKRDHSPQGE